MIFVFRRNEDFTVQSIAAMDFGGSDAGLYTERSADVAIPGRYFSKLEVPPPSYGLSSSVPTSSCGDQVGTHRPIALTCQEVVNIVLLKTFKATKCQKLHAKRRNTIHFNKKYFMC